MKIVAVVIISASAIFIARELSERNRCGLFLMEELMRFLNHARMQLVCFLRPQGELGDGFESDALTGVGFLPTLKKSGSLLSAYESAKGRLQPTEEEDRVISLMFSGFGRGYLLEEVKKLDSCLSELSALIDRRRLEMPKKCKLIKTLCATATAGLIILIA